MRARRVVVPALAAAALTACAAPKSPSDAASAGKGPAGDAAPSHPGQPYGQGRPESTFAQPPPGAEPSREAPPPPPIDLHPRPAPAPAAGAGAGGAPARELALQGASRDIDAAARELDVAAGDCRNACRALGSMDRATGRLCGLAQGGEEARRCEQAKQKLYSARDRVKTTCGDCPGGPSVERSAPVPSTR